MLSVLCCVLCVECGVWSVMCVEYVSVESLIQSGHAYVDKQSPDEIRINRGTLTEPGKNSPWRDKSIEEHLTWFREMRDGKHPDVS